NEILRACVHCGFCTATCPTFLELGDELDSPRGRIYLMKDMLESGRPADEKTVKHVDRCLSCLSCMTTCPSGVHYMHLVDHAREHIQKTYKRPLPERALRWILSKVLPNPTLFRLSLLGAQIARPFRSVLPGRLKGLVALAPAVIPSPSRVDKPQAFAADGPRRMRVALLSGCAQKALDPKINEATVRFLTRHGCEVVIAKGMGCCGALTHHMGKTDESHASAARNIAAWHHEYESGGLDAIVINTSGCGTTVKDYGHMFRNDPKWAEKAAIVSKLAKDVTELSEMLELKPTVALPPLKVAYHSACSMQHGQQIKELPLKLLRSAGFNAVPVPEGHICCGSAGTYNLMQPEIATRLQKRKVRNIERVAPDVIAAGNLGCMIQIGGATNTPIVHSVELLDWATGGEVPEALEPFLAERARDPLTNAADPANPFLEAAE
ncbi:MAG: glycolate oxidase subunit GlcF, partial [Pseudomonadota bacterium]